MNSKILFGLSLYALIPFAFFSCSDKLTVSDSDNNNETGRKGSFTIITEGLPEIEYANEDGTKAYFQVTGGDQSNWKFKFQLNDSVRLYNSKQFIKYDGGVTIFNSSLLRYENLGNEIYGFNDSNLKDSVQLPDEESTWYISYPAGINEDITLPSSKEDMYKGTVKFTGQSGEIDNIGKYFCCFSSETVPAKQISFRTKLVAATSIAIMQNNRDTGINIRFKTSKPEANGDQYIIGMRVNSSKPEEGFKLVTTKDIDDGTLICTIPAKGIKYVVIPAGVAFQVVEDGGYIVRITNGQTASVRFECPINDCTYTGLTYGIRWVELFDGVDCNTRWALTSSSGDYIAASSNDQIEKLAWNPSDASGKTEQKWILPSEADYEALFENTRMKYQDGNYEFARYADSEKTKVYKNIKTTFNQKGFQTNVSGEGSISWDKEKLYLWTSTKEENKRKFYLVQNTPADTNMVIGENGYEKKTYHSYKLPETINIQKKDGKSNYSPSELCFNKQYVLDRKYYNK